MYNPDCHEYDIISSSLIPDKADAPVQVLIQAESKVASSVERLINGEKKDEFDLDLRALSMSLQPLIESANINERFVCIIYGSRVRGNYKPDSSDIDIALVFMPNAKGLITDPFSRQILLFDFRNIIEDFLTQNGINCVEIHPKQFTSRNLGMRFKYRDKQHAEVVIGAPEVVDQYYHLNQWIVEQKPLYIDRSISSTVFI